MLFLESGELHQQLVIIRAFVRTASGISAPAVDLIRAAIQGTGVFCLLCSSPSPLVAVTIVAVVIVGPALHAWMSRRGWFDPKVAGLPPCYNANGFMSDQEYREQAESGTQDALRQLYSSPQGMKYLSENAHLCVKMAPPDLADRTRAPVRE